jgi:hypothetical protein
MIKFIDKYIYLLAAPTIPLIVLKLFGVVSLSWLGVFTPFLIVLTWATAMIITAGIASGMDALRATKND